MVYGFLPPFHPSISLPSFLPSFQVYCAPAVSSTGNNMENITVVHTHMLTAQWRCRVRFPSGGVSAVMRWLGVLDMGTQHQLSVRNGFPEEVISDLRLQIRLWVGWGVEENGPHRKNNVRKIKVGSWNYKKFVWSSGEKAELTCMGFVCHEITTMQHRPTLDWEIRDSFLEVMFKVKIQGSGEFGRLRG